MAHRILSRASWACVLSVLLGCPATASAQTGDGAIIIVGILYGLHQFADLSLGFSLARTTNTPGNEKVLPLGVQFGITIDVRKRTSIDAELAGQSGHPAGAGEPFHMFEYLFGPRFSARKNRATLFCHTLAGGVHHWQDSTGDPHIWYEGGGFAMAFGGGVDVNATEKVAFRVVQFDWIPIHENGAWTKNTVRLGFGMVFRSAK